ncbi:MAG: aminodeoxychorismate synthase, component I [Lentisphaerae bacterium RIFOXYA12_FULL_48_11]|nr:MAG: aminodeoxychorismate synthase, component I [Lentisphaerae bacterium RIFOXYA12_FULL_48_11]
MTKAGPRVILRDVDGREGWRLFREPSSILAAFNVDEVIPVLSAVEDGVARGLQAAGFISYEAAGGIDRVYKTRLSKTCPLVWFGLFENSEVVSLEKSSSFSLGAWRPSVSRSEYDKAMARIKNCLQNGSTYQVNYTMRLRAQFKGDPLALFASLYAAQKTGLAAFIETNDMAVCSVSPELFFALDGTRLISKPMKGTIRRGLTVDADSIMSAELFNSEKNRAENIMIVDMVRNDLGRVADTGSVIVPKMFEIEKYPTVFQMTSTVECTTNASFVNIIRALFPCASITGAPKVKTMEIIRDLEPDPRNIYTGCVGYLMPGRRARFNVAIRTAVIDKQNEEAEYGVGGGIVWDSHAGSEYEECLIKAEVLKRQSPDFFILETILWEDHKGYFLLEKHLARMVRSAEYFDYRVSSDDLEKKLLNYSESLGEGNHRIRVRADNDGRIYIESSRMPGPEQRWSVGILPNSVQICDVFLYHKTTNRSVYDNAKRSSGGSNDVILMNERGEITESTIANVVVEIDGNRFTPPVSCGLLAGVFREHLLEKGDILERVLTIDDFRRADKTFLINSVRKWVPVDVDFSTINA